MKLTQQDQARILGITTVTIRNWRRDKPKLYEMIMKGFAFDEAVQKAQQNADDLKELAKSFEASR